MMLKPHRDKHVFALVAAHGETGKRVRALLAAGVLPDLGQDPTLVHKRPDESVLAAIQRISNEGAPRISRADFQSDRAMMAAGRVLEVVVLSDERVAEACTLLKAERLKTDALTVHNLAGGDRIRIAEALARLEPARIGPLARGIMTAADLEEHHLAALVRCGLVPELQPAESTRHGEPDAAEIATDIPRRFLVWTPETFDFQEVKDLGVIRSGLRFAWTDDNPPGVLNPATDMLIRLGQTPTISLMQTTISGGVEQLTTHLEQRAKTKGDVPRPKRRISGRWKIESMRAVLPQQLHQLQYTALDDVRGSASDLVPDQQVGRVVTNTHKQLQIVGAVVTLHGRKVAAFKDKAIKAARSLGNLAGPLDGIDINNAAQLAAGFAATRLMLRALSDRIEIHRVNKDIDHWRFVIEIFDSYLKQQGLNEELVTFLSSVRPVWPSGGKTLFDNVQADLEEFKRESKTTLEGDLQPFLADVPGFIGQVLDAQAQIEALRNHIRGMVAVADKKSKKQITWPLSDVFTTRARLPDGEIADVGYHYKVHRWPDVMDRINERTRAFRPRKNDVRRSPFDLYPGDSRLFENRFVVELLGCRRDGLEIEYPLDIVRLHRDFGYWAPGDLPDAEASTLHYERLKEFGLRKPVLSDTGAGIANFERGKFARARKARVLFGMFLFPIDEVYHSSLIGAFHVAARSVLALRIGDLEQWNIGSGLETAYDDEGKPFTVLSSIPKKKKEARKSALTSELDLLADKLLAIVSERFFRGGPIPMLQRARYNGKGPEWEQMLLCTRKAGMHGSTINNHSRLLMGGNGRFKSQWGKYLWSRLARMAKLTLEERQKAHGHSKPETTEYYDVLTPDEMEALLRVLKDQAETRAQWIRGERASPQPDPPLDRMQFERRRLLHEIDFLKKEDAPNLAKVRADLSLLESKIRRVEATT